MEQRKQRELVTYIFENKLFTSFFSLGGETNIFFGSVVLLSYKIVTSF